METARPGDPVLPPQIANAWRIHQDPQTHPRERFKAAKAAAHHAIAAFEAGERDAQRLALYVDIVAAGMKAHTFPQEFARARNRMIAVMLNLRGVDNVATRVARKKSIAIVSGVLVVGDRQTRLAAEPGLWNSSMESGQAAICALASDGPFACELRVVDAAEPVLAAKDYRSIRESTEEVVVDLASGAVRCADAAHFVGGADPKAVGCVEVSVEPGRYKVAFFSKERGGLIVVLAPTDAPARNDRQGLLELNV